MSQNGTTEEPLVPSELSILLKSYSDETDRDAIRKAYYVSATGDPNTYPVQFAVLLSANAQLFKAYPASMRKLFETEGRKLGDQFASHQAVVKQNTAAIGRSVEDINALNQKIDALEQTVFKFQKNEIAAREKQNEYFKNECSTTRTAGEEYRQLKINTLWLALVLAASFGSLLTALIIHFFR